MFYVYVLYSLKDFRLYIGYTSNLRRRFREHENGLVKSTKKRRLFQLLYYEAYICKINAERRERFYKSGRGREVIKKILRESFENINGRVV